MLQEPTTSAASIQPEQPSTSGGSNVLAPRQQQQEIFEVTYHKNQRPIHVDDIIDMRCISTEECILRDSSTRYRLRGIVCSSV